MLINSERIQELFSLPPVQWEEWAEKHPNELWSTQRDLEAIAEFAARMAEYFSIRAMGGDHKQAVKASNGRVAKVRKAIGCLQPENDIMF